MAMTENDVKVAINEAFEYYEKNTGRPRHEENLGNFSSLFDFVSRAKGAFAVAAVVVGLPAVFASCIIIIKFAQGKP